MSKNIDIIRNLPEKKSLIVYPKRYDKCVFDKFTELINNKKFIGDYNKWKSGINPETNRKIKIGGDTHRNLRYNFIVCDRVYYDELENINIVDYMAETDVIHSGIDRSNATINQRNKLIYGIKNKINSLSNWDDYVEFDGNKYGTAKKVIECVHIENNCGGLMIFTHTTSGYSYNYYGNGSRIYANYECDKCGYRMSKVISN